VQLLASLGRLHDVRAAQCPLPLPEGVRDAIRRRLAPLTEEAMHALSAAAVLGREFGLVTLARRNERSAAYGGQVCDHEVPPRRRACRTRRAPRQRRSDRPLRARRYAAPSATTSRPTATDLA
jgi:hypothetical protein